MDPARVSGGLPDSLSPPGEVAESELSWQPPICLSTPLGHLVDAGRAPSRAGRHVCLA